MSFFAQLIPYLSLVQRSLPKEFRPVVIKSVGNLLAGIQENRKKIAGKNLSKLGLTPNPELTQNTVRNWTACLGDQLRSLWLSKQQLFEMVDDEGGSKRITCAVARGMGAILVTGHLGNYELAGSYLAARGFPVHAVVEEIPGHTEVINRIRMRFGMGVVGYTDIGTMLRILRAGRILVLLADRDLEGNGVEVNFGCGKRRVPVGPALLSLRTGATVMSGYFVLDRNRYRFCMNPPMDMNLTGSLGDKTSTLSRMISSQLEQMVKRYPTQWFCFQDDWV